MVLPIVQLDLFESFLSESLLEHFHGGDLLTDFWHRVCAFDILLAAWALHKVESDALGAPTMAQEFSNAASVEDMATFKL